MSLATTSQSPSAVRSVGCFGPYSVGRGTNAVLKIVLSAANVSNQSCFGIQGTTTIRGIVFSGFWDKAVNSTGGTGVHVTGCFFGIEADGLTPNGCNTLLSRLIPAGSQIVIIIIQFNATLSGPRRQQCRSS